MNIYDELIKNKYLHFDQLLIDHYASLQLSEAEAIILIKLYRLYQSGVRKLSVKDLAPSMSLSEATISKKLVDLMNNGFINLNIDETTKTEQFDLNKTIKKLSFLLEARIQELHLEDKKSQMKATVALLEREFKKILSPIELDIVSQWVREDQFSVEDIEKGINECVRLRKTDVKYLDVLLNKKRTTTATNQDFADVFHRIHGKTE
ncbi:MAG: DnaD domain protein [Bacilli bacterium]|nr:DnaD domain protein [Bacilli bacterium]